MCWLSKWFKKSTPPEEQEKPNWVTQSKEKVAEEEIYAASIHLTYLELLKDNRDAWLAFGDEAWHDRWYRKHMEAAWYTSPEYCKEKGIA